MENCNDQFLKFLNLARQSPKHFINLLESQLATFVNNKQIPLTNQIMYETNEGKSAWIEAKHFLLKQSPLPPLAKHDGLCQSARCHQEDICANGTFDHKGNDGSTFCERILRFCKKGPGAMAEMIGLDFDVGGRKSAEFTILGLIVDDGISDRGHRKTIFNPIYKHVGWSTGKQQEKIVTVFNLLENNLPLVNEKQDSQNKENEGNIEDRKEVQKGKRIGQMGSWQEVPFKNILNHRNIEDGALTTGSKLKKRLSEKHENTRTFYEEGAKVIETTTKLIYKDGSVEESVQRKTIYDD